MIRLEQLKGMDEEDVVNLLLEQKQQPFEIHIPKLTDNEPDPLREIADDYAFYAYAGYLLERISNFFEYTFVTPSKRDYVRFVVGCNDLVELAQNLLDISTGDINEPPGRNPYAFFDATQRYLTGARSGKLKATCPDFIETYIKFLNESNKKYL